MFEQQQPAECDGVAEGGVRPNDMGPFSVSAALSAALWSLLSRSEAGLEPLLLRRIFHVSNGDGIEVVYFNGMGAHLLHPSLLWRAVRLEMGITQPPPLPPLRRRRGKFRLFWLRRTPELSLEEGIRKPSMWPWVLFSRVLKSRSYRRLWALRRDCDGV